MKEVDAAVKKLDERVRAEAFAMMRDYILRGAASVPGGAGGSEGDDAAGTEGVVAPEDFDGFIDQFDSDVPANNVTALAAWLYKEYGTEPFSVKEVKDLADQANMTIPDRADVTLRGRSVNKKKLFRQTKNGFRPTVEGEGFLKKTYGVRKGNKKRTTKS